LKDVINIRANHNFFFIGTSVWFLMRWWVFTQPTSHSTLIHANSRMWWPKIPSINHLSMP
jgi:hypothetical protein